MIVHHVCIQTNCYEESRDFYTKMLGFDLIKESANFHGRDWNTWLRSEDGFLIELQTPKGSGQFAPMEKEAAGLAHLCFVVPDVAEEAARLMALGYDGFRRKQGAAVYEVLGSKLCKLTAPEGTIIELRDTIEL